MLTRLQVEQFIEVIFPTHNPKALAVVAETEEAAKTDPEAAKDIFYMMVAVVGTCAFISALMVRSGPARRLLGAN